MSYGVSRTAGLGYLILIVWLFHSLWLVASSADCLCGQKTGVISSCCGDKTAVLSVSVKASMSSCCQEASTAEIHDNDNLAKNIRNCLWCSNWCGCSGPGKTESAVLYKNSIGRRRNLFDCSHFQTPCVMPVRESQRADSGFLPKNPLLGFGRSINVLLCVFLC